MNEMQTRRTSLNHHHQDRFANATRERSSPEADLVALAQSKGQLLTEPTLRLIRESLELRGVTLEVFVADVRPHFRNNILNPSGFLIDRARRFLQLSRPAAIPVPSPTVPTAISCGVCKGQTYILTEKEIMPCPECSTAEFRNDWEAKEIQRASRIASEKASRLKAISD
jgi:RNA polymerase subunit RPABC4/transcription elongation factor Spt4